MRRFLKDEDGDLADTDVIRTADVVATSSSRFFELSVMLPCMRSLLRRAAVPARGCGAWRAARMAWRGACGVRLAQEERGCRLWLLVPRRGRAGGRARRPGLSLWILRAHGGEGAAGAQLSYGAAR